MFAGPNWLYSIVYLAGSSLIAAVQIAGLVVALRRWHVGMAARLAAIGFGLLALSMVGHQAFNFAMMLWDRVTTSAGGEWVLYRHMIANSVGTVVTTAGYVMLVLALRVALIGCERGRDASSGRVAPGPWQES